jgi:hypothetical protein
MDAELEKLMGISANLFRQLRIINILPNESDLTKEVNFTLLN